MSVSQAIVGNIHEEPWFFNFVNEITGSQISASTLSRIKAQQLLFLNPGIQVGRAVIRSGFPTNFGLAQHG